MLISKQTSDALDVLLGAFFDLNRTTDRMVSVMQNKFSMPKASSVIHHHIAHLYPLLADKCSEIKDRYNMTSVYPETHRDARDYENMKDMFETLLKENVNVYELIKLTYKVAEENGDFNVGADLIDIMRLFSEVVGQIYTLRDKGVELVDKFDQFDDHVTVYGIVGIPELFDENTKNTEEDGD